MVEVWTNNGRWPRSNAYSITDERNNLSVNHCVLLVTPKESTLVLVVRNGAESEQKVGVMFTLD